MTKNKKKNCLIKGSYLLMPQAKTYALGIHALREVCKKEKNLGHPQFIADNGCRVYRPLTFKENLEARINNYKSGKSRLFKETWDSCTGIAYKAGTTKFKIIPLCKELIMLDKNFREVSLLVDYNSLDGIELDVITLPYEFNWEDLPYHPFWQAAAGDNLSLLKTYSEIISLGKRRDEASWSINFDARSCHEHIYFDELRKEYQSKYKVDRDELRALTLGDLEYHRSKAFIKPLSSGGCFIRINP